MTRTMEHWIHKIEGPRAVEDPLAELNEQARSGRYTFLLAHADDGVIWGRVENQQLALSTDAFPDVSPKLRPETLQQARLFGTQTELFLWRDDTGWHARELSDAKGGEAPAYDEAVILWGTDAEKQNNGFTLLKEADLGIRHASPLPLVDRRKRSLRLVMRHYVDFDEAGAAYVKLSRLVDIRNGGGDDI